MSSEILQTSQALKKATPKLEKSGQAIAKKLSKKIPVVYSSNRMGVVAHIWKIKFNENSKIPAFYNCFPELNHNEMVGYTEIKKLGAKNFYTILLQDSTDHPRILKRMDLTAKIIKKSGVGVQIIQMQTGTLLFKIFSGLLLGDWVSYYLALKQSIDPTPVKMVEEFKKLMKN
jgi:glucose/mannose-6-phosphate isomerase